MQNNKGRFVRDIKHKNSMVCADIYDTTTGEVVAWGWFFGILNDSEKNFKKAHKWADKKIEVLEKYTDTI